jgi:adenylosuccinate synthase
MKGFQMVNSIAVLGLQWGDEGKGKVIDYLSQSCDAVARFGGGSNAGHTIVVNGQKFILRLLPSGILHPGKVCLIGTGVALDPEVLRDEIKALGERGVRTDGRIFIDYAAHIVLPLHKMRDSHQETSRGKGAIDTTKRGIGPSYSDRINRIGIRVADLFDAEILNIRLDSLIRLQPEYATSESTVSAKKAELLKYLDEFKPLLNSMMTDIGKYVIDHLDNGKSLLFEGAHGSLLDVDYGTYPYVTSSHTTIGGIFTGLGIPPSYLGQAVGVTKSYMTRVGHGPFPTEITGDLGVKIREKGAEFGSVTGRPRRVGWLDLVALKRMIKQNGVNKLAVTKLDVLDGLDEIYVCESYEGRNGESCQIPPNHPDFCLARPIYVKLPGWSGSVAGCRKLVDLPANSRAYLDYLEKAAGIPIWLISTGHGRESTILIE